MKTQSLYILQWIFLSFLFSNHSFAQSPFITRVDGVGAGNNFLKISTPTKNAILNGSFNGEITYLPNHAPVQINFLPTNTVLGEYELKLTDDTPTDEELGPEIFWTLTNLSTGESVNSISSINDMPEQEVPEFGLIVKVNQTQEVGTQGPNNGAIGFELAYSNGPGQNWLDWIPDDFNEDPRFNFIETAPGEFSNALDPEEKLTNVAEGLFYPYQLFSHIIDPGTVPSTIAPKWQDLIYASLEFNSDIIGDLKNVDIVFTPDKNLWSRCIILETAIHPYYSENGNHLGLQTAYDDSYMCEVINYDLRGDYSVGKFDNDNDGLPDRDNEIDFEGFDKIGMGWFPGYAIDVETGKRLNIFFGENSAYSLEQAPEILNELNITTDIFDGPPRGHDMMWNPSSEHMIDAGDADGFPYQYYAGGQQYIYVTSEEYDSCSYLYERLKCENSGLQKVNAIKRIMWASFPMTAEGHSLLSYNDGLIPNETTVRLRVDNPFQVENGTGNFNGYPTYRFDIAVSNTFNESPLYNDLKISPNPVSSSNSYSVILEGIETNMDITLIDVNGRIIHEIKTTPTNVFGNQINISNHLGNRLLKGTYFVQVRDENGFGKTMKLVLL